MLADFVKGAKSIEFCRSILQGMEVTCERKKNKSYDFCSKKYSGNLIFTLNNDVLDIVYDVPLSVE